MATVFINKGYPLISDDVIPVTLKDENIPYVTPILSATNVIFHFRKDMTHKLVKGELSYLVVKSKELLLLEPYSKMLQSYY